jgi:hypothetical protein
LSALSVTNTQKSTENVNTIPPNSTINSTPAHKMSEGVFQSSSTTVNSTVSDHKSESKEKELAASANMTVSTDTNNVNRANNKRPLNSNALPIRGYLSGLSSSTPPSMTGLGRAVPSSPTPAQQAKKSKTAVSASDSSVRKK